jgi:NAD(P)H-dependent flavin oxidoreductase YrpB (nitropropane dioxygenase family)
MEWQTRVTKLLGIRYPIIQGAFGLIGNANLAVAVSEAGGLGMITATALRTPERLRKEIRRARSMTDKPFAVNISPTVDPGLGVMREVAIEEKVPVIETAGYRSADHGKRVKEAGLIWIHKVTTVKHAIAAERDGADAVCIVGLEGAAFKNPTTLTTLVSIPLAVRQVKIPVIAAGGIGDARGFLAALALGAEAVLLGTLFLAAKECPLSERRKQALVKADPYDPQWRDLVLTTPKPGDMEKVIEHVKEVGGSEAILRAVAEVEMFGMRDPSLGFPYPASSAVGFIDRIVTARELIDGIIKGAEEILTSGGIGGWRLVPKPLV